MTHFATISVIYGTLWWILGTKRGANKNKPPKPLVYKSMSKQIYKKNPAFYTGLNQTMNQTKQQYKGSLIYKLTFLFFGIVVAIIKLPFLMILYAP